MQLIKTYLYPNRVDAFTNAFSEWPTERYRRVYNRNLKIYRGVDNKIDIQVKNSDEKHQNITGSTLVFSLVNPNSGELILQKDCILQSTLTGKVYITLFESEMNTIESGMYQYSLHSEVRTAIDNDNYVVQSKKPLYIDTQYGVPATMEIVGDVFGEPMDSVVVEEFRERINYENLETPSIFFSSIIEARSRFSIPQSVHSFQFNLTNFYGTLVIQASQDEGASPNIWFDVATIESANQNILYKNVTGKYNWFRIKYTPRFTENLALFNVSQNTYSFEYTVTIGTGGKGYTVNDVIVIPGRNLNSETPDNNLTITVTEVDNIGKITAIAWIGSSQNGVGQFIVSDPSVGAGSVDSILYR